MHNYKTNIILRKNTMTNTTNFLAFDLGAESGRAVVGRFDGDKLSLEEVHRFPNGPTRVLDRLHWNPLNLFAQMKQGLAKAVNELDFEISAIGLDTWGVDFGLLDKNGQNIASAGDLDGIDTTSLASLTAGNVAATDGLAKLIGEKEFSILFHEGENEHLHINVVASRGILVVLFDERSSLGLVRLRVKKASVELSEILEEIAGRDTAHPFSTGGAPSPFSEITDDDIDALFS